MAYRATRPLWYATNQAAIRKIKAGEHPPFRERGMRHVGTGAIAEGLPAESVPWLLAKGWIVAEPPDSSQEGGD